MDAPDRIDLPKVALVIVGSLLLAIGLFLTVVAAVMHALHRGLAVTGREVLLTIVPIAAGWKILAVVLKKRPPERL